MWSLVPVFMFHNRARFMPCCIPLAGDYTLYAMSDGRENANQEQQSAIAPIRMYKVTSQISCIVPSVKRILVR